MKRRHMIFTGAAVTAALTLVGCAAGATNRNRRTRRDTPPLGQFLTVDGLRVHYVMEGKPSTSKPPLVLIHGAGSNLRDWTFSLSDKLKDQFAIIAFDRPGHGYTPSFNPTGESLAEQADLLHSALQQLGIKQALTAGHSYGGAVALAWTLNHPESVLGTLLISSVSNPWAGDVAPLYKYTSSRLTGGLVSNSIAALVPQRRIASGFRSVFTPQAMPEGYVEHMGADMAVRASQLRANGRQVSTMKPHVQQMTKRYGEIKTAVEIIHGSADQSVPAEVHSDILSKQIPHAVYQRLEGMGHGTQQLAQSEILAALGRLRQDI